MKKISALLLTAVLGSSMVFAGISGDVTTTYGMDLTEKTLGFTNGNAVEAEFEFSAENEKISEGDIHAEIVASLTIKTDTLTADEQSTDLTVDGFDLSAKIVGSNWYVDIREAVELGDYAADFAIDDADDAFHNYSFVKKPLAGITMGYTYEEGKTVVVAFGSTLDFDDTDASTYFAVASPAFDLTDGFTAEFALALQNVNSAVDFGGGMKMAFTDADSNSSFVAAMDMGYVDEKFDIEACVTGTYSLATIEAYFATTADSTLSTEGGETGYTYDLESGVNLLSAKVTLDLDQVVENVPVTVYAQLSGMDATLATYQMNAGVDYTIAMEEASLAIGFDGGIRFFNTDAWMIGGDLEYTAADDAYVACASLGYEHSANALAPAVSVESTTLVNGATLTLAYAGASLALDTSGTSVLGSINATCLIEF